MADTACRVMFRGETIEGFVKEEVFVTFASMMKRPLYYVEPYFSGHTVCLKSRLNRERADLVCASLRRLGMDVWVECAGDTAHLEDMVDTAVEPPEREGAPEGAGPTHPRQLEPLGESLVKALLEPGGGNLPKATERKDALQGTAEGPADDFGKRNGTGGGAGARNSGLGTRLPQVVERVELPRGEYCSFLAFFLIMILSFVGGTIGTALAYLLIFRLHVHSSILTVLFIWSGTLLGVRLGDRLGGHCAKPHIVMLAVSPIALVMFGVSFFQTFTYLLDSSRSVVWGVLESVCLFATPLLALMVVRSGAHCPACRKAYRTRQLFSSPEASPEKVRAYLDKGRVPKDGSYVAADKDFPRAQGQMSVRVETTYCPACMKAVVNAELVHKDTGGKERERLFFSRKWSGHTDGREPEATSHIPG